MKLTSKVATPQVPEAMAEAKKLPECVRVESFEHWLRSLFERRKASAK